MYEEETPEATAREHEKVMLRVRLFAVLAYVTFAILLLIFRGIWSFLGLTCSALVVMINFLWLEAIVVKFLQPAPQVSAWRMALGSLARFALFGVALAVTIFVARFDALSVLLGFSIIVAGIMGEALFETIRAFSRDRSAANAGK